MNSEANEVHSGEMDADSEAGQTARNPDLDTPLQPPIYNEMQMAENDAESGAEKVSGEDEGTESFDPESLALVVRAAVAEVLIPTRPMPLGQNPAAVYLASLSISSRRTMRASLNTIAALLTGRPDADAFSLDWSQVRFQHTTAVRSHLAETYSHNTANKMLAALRGTLKAAWRLEQMSAEAYQRAADIGTVTGESLPAGRSIAAGELIGLMKACEKETTPAGARDAAMLGLLYGCGLRRAELTALDRSDYEPGAEAGMGTLKVKGKRNKARVVPVVGGAAEALTDWLAVHPAETGPLFVRIRKGGAILPHSRLTTQAVYHVLMVRANEAGLVSCSPHDMRRTFVGDLLEAGADIATVQKLAGHANVTTTARYDRRGEATKRKAAGMLHVPYFKWRPPAETPTEREGA